MAKKIEEVIDIAIRIEFNQEIATMAALVPVADVVALEKIAEECRIESDEDLDVAVARAGRALGWADKLAKAWEPRKQFFWTRYKAINAAIDSGVELNGATVVGASRLKKIRDKFEAAAKQYARSRESDAARKQKIMDGMVSSGKKEIEDTIEDAAARGDMQTVRELRRDLEAVQPVVIMERPLDVQGAAVSEPCIWKLEDEAGMMALVKAVASGQVPLYHNIKVKGEEQRRCLFDLSDPVVNQSVRKMGMGLGWPGIRIEKDMKFAIEKRG